MTTHAICPACRLRMSCSADAQVLRCDRCQHIFACSMEAIPSAIPADEGSEPILWWQGNSIEGLNAQAGVVVLRSAFVAFIPTAKARNLIGVLADGVASAASPIQKISLSWLQSRPDPLQMVSDLWRERPEDFDSCLFEIVEHLGGFVWARTAAKVARSAKGTSVGSEALTFLRHEAELRGYAPAGPVLDRLLQGWQETVPSAGSDCLGLVVVSVLPLLLAVALFVGSLLTPDIPAWAPLIGLGLAGLLYLIGGIKVLWLRLQLRRKPHP